jgi:eukaryotic-like serine/threonine-protein kinase
MLRKLKKLFKNLGFIGGLTVGLVLLTLLIIHFYTGHGKENVVIPVVEGLRIDKAIDVLEEQGFRYLITDTVYRDGVELMTIIDQIPEANFAVKKGRTIYLVLNTDAIPKVPMPALAGRTSLKEARQILKIKGLELGEIIERRDPSVVDPSSVPVLDQYIGGDTLSIEPGTQIERHSKIDLVIGIMMEDLIEGEDGFAPEVQDED